MINNMDSFMLVNLKFLINESTKTTCQPNETYRNYVSKCCNDSRIEIGVEFRSGGVGSIGKF